MQRALHQIVDVPRVLDDPLAVRILGADAASALQAAADRPSRGLRAYIAMRSRHAEDRLAEAVSRGVRQYVVLGAGLDTFACRNPHPGLRVFEVDYPATQDWKRGRLAAVGIAEPPSRLEGAALASRQRSMAAMAAIGEPWRTFLEPESVPSRLRALGFSAVEVLTPEQANQRYFGGRVDRLRVPASSHMATAFV
jgi:O-methyltransferase involved in polyketide biosynthesis